jgi:hypothetical protein
VRRIWGIQKQRRCLPPLAEGKYGQRRLEAFCGWQEIFIYCVPTFCSISFVTQLVAVQHGAFRCCESSAAAAAAIAVAVAVFGGKWRR